jgi:phospholipid/cholesterol/gamma-HCH transport system ATP-binding protein
MADAQLRSAISVRNLRMGYGTRVLLDQASFDVYREQIVVILGGSGSGKSSLMKPDEESNWSKSAYGRRHSHRR